MIIYHKICIFTCSFCFILFWLYHNFKCIHATHLPLFFRNRTLPLVIVAVLVKEHFRMMMRCITKLNEWVKRNTKLSHWGRVTHICVGKLTIIASDNGLSSGRCQAIMGTNDGILLIGPLGTNFSEILIAIHTFSSKKIDLKISSGKWRPSCLGLNVLNLWRFHRAITIWLKISHEHTRTPFVMIPSSNGNIFRVTAGPFVWGIHRSPVNSPHKGQWRGAVMFFFDLRP